MRALRSAIGVFLLLLGPALQAEDWSEIRIRLFSQLQLDKAIVTMDTGLYHILAVNEQGQLIDTIYDVFPEDSQRTFYLSTQGDHINLYRGSEQLGKFRRLYFRSRDSLNQFRIAGAKQERAYYGDLRFWSRKNKLRVVNQVSLEHYVAGVVESEAGHVGLLEFFKAQAVLARTYAIRNWDKHLDEGYNLKDDVSSQVYRDKAHYTYRDLIYQAVEATRDTLLVLANCRPILSVFHANSGGVTLNSEDVWLSPVSYLRSREDSFSIGVGSYRWERHFTPQRFFGYFARKLGVPNDLDLQKNLLNFDQEERSSHYRFGSDSVKLTEVRRDLHLRSTYFSVSKEGEEIILQGRGFGHGVGLSQDGAIEMARMGYSYREILRHYFAEVELEALERAQL